MRSTIEMETHEAAKNLQSPFLINYLQIILSARIIRMRSPFYQVHIVIAPSILLTILL